MNGAAAGHFFETWCFTEILKSYCNAGISADLSYYRDKDEREIDLIIQQNGILYPIEFKKAGTPKTKDVKAFERLEIFQQPQGMGALVSLCPDLRRLQENVRCIPAWQL